VSIDIKDKKPQAGQTDTFGRFELDLPRLIPGWSADNKSVTLIFRKAEFQEAHRVLVCSPTNQAECENLIVPMARLVSEQDIPLAVQEKLKPLISKEGQTLFLMPYVITPLSDTGPPPLPKQDYLSVGLFRAITTYLQALPLSGATSEQLAPPEVGLENLEAVLPWTNPEKVRRYGFFLNALAMIGGFGEIRRDQSGKPVVAISSSFITMPSLPGISTLEIVDDNLPVDLINSPKLAEKFSRRWGLRTLMAISVRDFKRAKARGDRLGIERVRAYLIAEKAQLSKDHPDLPLVEGLLNMVRKELGS
jgi:hypothetical protein